MKTRRRGTRGEIEVPGRATARRAGGSATFRSTYGEASSRAATGCRRCSRTTDGGVVAEPDLGELQASPPGFDSGPLSPRTSVTPSSRSSDCSSTSPCSASSTATVASPTGRHRPAARRPRPRGSARRSREPVARAPARLREPRPWSSPPLPDVRATCRIMSTSSAARAGGDRRPGPGRGRPPGAGGRACPTSPQQGKLSTRAASAPTERRRARSPTGAPAARGERRVRDAAATPATVLSTTSTTTSQREQVRVSAPVLGARRRDPVVAACAGRDHLGDEPVVDRDAPVVRATTTGTPRRDAAAPIGIPCSPPGGRRGCSGRPR